MLKALLLIFTPIPVWDRIAEARRGIPAILLMSSLPVLLLVTAGECYGISHWGKQRGEFGHPVTLALPGLIKYAVLQIVFNLAAIFAGGFVVRAVGETFHGRHDYTQGFTVVAYALTPYFLMRLADAAPAWPWWLTWIIGIMLTLSALYTGIPIVMKPDPAHAIGLYFMSSLLLLMITGLAAFLGHMVLEQAYRAAVVPVT